MCSFYRDCVLLCVKIRLVLYGVVVIVGCVFVVCVCVCILCVVLVCLRCAV